MLLQLHFSHYNFQEQNTCRLRLQLYVCISFKIEFMQTVSTINKSFGHQNLLKTLLDVVCIFEMVLKIDA